MSAIVSALFVQSDGIYAADDRIDAWDERRDARTFRGKLPVIAHPPCQKWGNLAKANFARWGGEHNRPDEDEGCFEAAIRAVEKNGGVLEHPAYSRAFMKYAIAPDRHIRGWTKTMRGGWSCEVWQSAYGHRANKATWLYYFGVALPLQLRWDRPRGTHQVGYPDKRGITANKPTLSKREANATPAEFMEDLVRLAIHSQRRQK